MTQEKPLVTIPGAYKPGEKTTQAFGICIYGPGGVGKTTLTGTMPGRGLLIDVPQIEGGDFVLADKGDRIDVVSVDRWEKMQEVFTFLKLQPHPYKWCAIDSITAMTELAKRYTIQTRDNALLMADKHQITQPEWGKIGRLIAEMVYQFRTLSIHTIWIAQERRFGNEDRGEDQKIGPDTSPSALQALLPSLMLVGRLSVETTMKGEWERHLRVGPHPLFYTKARTKPGVDMPHIINSPDLRAILMWMFGKGVRPDEVTETSLILG